MSGGWTRPPALGFQTTSTPAAHLRRLQGCGFMVSQWGDAQAKRGTTHAPGTPKRAPGAMCAAGRALHSTAGDGERGRAAERRLAYAACLLGSSCGIILLPGWGCWLRPDPANASKQGDPGAFMRSPN